MQQGYYLPLQLGSVWTIQYVDLPAQVWMDCAGELAPGARFFDFDHEETVLAQPNYGRDILIAATDNFAVVNQLNNPNGGPPLNLRRVQLQQPYTVSIIERDDGGHCPTPPKNVDANISVNLQFIPYWHYQYSWTSAFRFIWDLFHQNDPVASWSFTTSGLVSASGASYLGGDADIFIKNEGFNPANIPPAVNPQVNLHP